MALTAYYICTASKLSRIDFWGYIAKCDIPLRALFEMGAVCAYEKRAENT